MLYILIGLGVLSIIGIIVSHLSDFEDALFGWIIFFLFGVGFIGFFILGNNVTDRKEYKVISKENFEVFQGKYVTIVSSDEDIYTFDDVKTYNLVKEGKDSIYFIREKYNMYGRLTNESLYIYESMKEIDKDIIPKIKIEQESNW